MPAAELAHLAGVGTSVIKTMASVGLLEARRAHDAALLPAARRRARGARRCRPSRRRRPQGLVDKVQAHAFSATLLDGVPGAGKTEVYFEAIAAALAAGRQVLVLLPEIALTAQWLKRFEDRFGATPAPWHSGLTSLERRETWRAIAEGRVGVVVGARSALFLPFANLGLIVVDEEHDSSFKQEDGVSYNARDMAVVRARLVVGAGRAGLGDAVAGERRQRRRRPLRRAASAGAPWRPPARDVVGRSTSSASRRRAAAGCRRRWSRR